MDKPTETSGAKSPTPEQVLAIGMALLLNINEGLGVPGRLSYVPRQIAASGQRARRPKSHGKERSRG